MKVKVTLSNVLEKKDETLYSLAQKTGIAYSTLHKMSNNKTNSISFIAIEKICKALNCKVEDIITLESL